MPKVNDIYFEEKRNGILNAAFRVCLKKPLYEVTMKDIIEETGLSQGGIYRYYNNIHEIFFALADKETRDKQLREKTDAVLSSANTPEEVIAELIKLIFHYTEGDVGKIIFELSLILANDPEMYEKFCEQVSVISDESYLAEKAAAYIAEKIETGYFKPIAPLEDILSLLSASVDGVNRDVIMTKYYKVKPDLPVFDIKKLTALLTKQLILTLGGKIND